MAHGAAERPRWPRAMAVLSAARLRLYVTVCTEPRRWRAWYLDSLGKSCGAVQCVVACWSEEGEKQK